MKKRIALDMDEVIADIMPKFFDLYEQEFGKRVDPNLLLGKKVYGLPGGAFIRDRIYDKGFFRDLPVMEGSQEGVKELMEHYDVYITTAAMEFRNSFEDKYDWLKEHFPFIHWKNVIFCGDKSIFNTEYMIDDHAKNLVTFRGKGLLFSALHNHGEERFTRVNNWKEVLQFFEKERKQVAG